MKKNFLFKGVSILGAVLLLATSVMPGLQYAYADPIATATDPYTWEYIYDEASWNQSYANGALKKYYENNPSEDLWNTSTNGAPGFNDKIYTVKMWTNADLEGDPVVKQFKAEWYSDNGVQRIYDVAEESYAEEDRTYYYLPTFFDTPSEVFELYAGAEGGYVATVDDLVYPCSRRIKVDSVSFGGENVVHSWQGAINAPGAKYPWAIVNIPEGGFFGKIKFEYEGKDPVYPWGEEAVQFNNYAIASIPGVFNDDSFLINNVGFNSGDFSITLIPAYTVTFDTNEGECATETACNDQIVDKGNLAIEPADPTKEGYVFLGWFEDEATSFYDFTTPVTKDVNLIAKWVLESNVVTFITSNNNPLPVVFDKDNGNSIDLENTQALFNKLPAPDPSDTESIAILNYILTTDSTEGAEIYKIGNEYVLFFNVNKVMPSIQQTKAFRQEGSELFNADSFKNNDTNTDATVISYDLENENTACPSWVDKDEDIKSYNEVKDGEVVIGYTFHTNTKYGWFYAPAKYNVTFVDVDDTELKEATAYAYGTKTSDIALPENLPTKAADSTCNTYELGWTPALADVTGDITYKAEFTCTSQKSSGGSSGGGGGGGSSKTSASDDAKTITGDNAKLDDTKADETKSEENNDENKDGEKTAPMTEAQAVEKFGQEQIDAYKWALENGITTMKTVEAARLDEPLTRAELAKMMVVYIQKVLQKDPILTGNVNYSDVGEELGDLFGYIKLAYQYQIMGINADGTPIELFNPHGIVSRGEYATVFSRVLFGAKFNKSGEDFYTNHLEALKTAGILTNTLPSIQEMRGWVMLMMYRSSQNGEAIEKVANSTEEVENVEKAGETVSEETVNASDEEKSEEEINTDETTKDSTEESVSDESSETPVNTAEATTGDALSE